MGLELKAHPAQAQAAGYGRPERRGGDYSYFSCSSYTPIKTISSLALRPLLYDASPRLPGHPVIYLAALLQQRCERAGGV